jgi:hypothetical protein
MNSTVRNKITFLILALLVLAGCDIGQPGVDDETDPFIAGIIEPWRGVWYSYSGNIRTDGYRVGRWKEIKSVMGSKLDLFPNFDPDNPRLYDAYEIKGNDYFIFYDDTVYGEDENGEGGNGGWGGTYIFRYIGIVRAINVFNDDTDTGAVIIEYLEGCYPGWSQDVLKTPLPFFGIYYRVNNSDNIQLANAIDIEALRDEKAYHTETATLEEAISKNIAENDSKFISWGVALPQKREQ